MISFSNSTISKSSPSLGLILFLIKLLLVHLLLFTVTLPTLLSTKSILILPFSTDCSGKNALAVTKPLFAYKAFICSIAAFMSEILTSFPINGCTILFTSDLSKISDGETVTVFTNTLWSSKP